jgi:uncharacterized protein with ParB-like and HNH nuclease domain
MQIKPVDRSVRQLLEAGFYTIPRFQRPYSWDQENVDDFWTDTITNEEPDYFIGSFVLYRESEHSTNYFVVDGQQRLTTITILLAAIRNALDSLEIKDLAKGIQKLIERENLESQYQYVLQTETSYPFLQEYIQKHSKPELDAAATQEQEALELAFRYLTLKVEAVLNAVDIDPQIQKKNKSKEKQQRLVRMRDSVLRLQLIVVELTNEDDAYLIFETLNTRGKDLGVSDLVKNHVTRLLRPKNKGVDVARDKWKKLRSEFDASAADIDLNSFLYHSWLSRKPYLGKERLFKAIKTSVLNSNATEYLDALLDDAVFYRALFEPNAQKWMPTERDISQSLRALNIFRVIQPVPMTLSILRSYKSGKLTLSQAKSILRDMENFHVQFTAVTAQRTGGGTAKMYAATAEELAVASSKDRSAQILKTFKQKMRERIPSLEEFTANFREIGFHSSNTKQKSLVQYLLRRFDETQRSDPLDYASMTIEHIAPESPIGKTSAIEEVGMLGNLILLPEKINAKLGNQPFTQKIAILKSSKVPLDPILENAKQWTSKEVIDRTNYLAELGYAKIFKV